MLSPRGGGGGGGDVTMRPMSSGSGGSSWLRGLSAPSHGGSAHSIVPHSDDEAVSGARLRVRRGAPDGARGARADTDMQGWARGPTGSRRADGDDAMSV